MLSRFRWVLGVAALWVLRGLAAEDPFAANVRPTEPLAPADQQKMFELPPGFEIQSVAQEPDIHKPMNLAFDALGRLWVSTSIEYPYPAPTNQPGRDRIMIFEDFGPEGRARKVTTFADGLNIPIGVYPFRSRGPGPAGARTWKAVVWSIPNVWLLEDTDGDGRADRREVLYGPFDHTRDTHGNQASFRRGFDGWLYATHGYNNDSHVAGRDGHRVDLNSGNTYRLRLDGYRVEHHTWGQVNPFGLAWNPAGDLFSSDCHSEPIYLLQAGGYYPSFGKPHDGLGFAPNMMEQIRGSTALDGITYYADDLWPEEYRDSVFIGDVMTSRVYRDQAAERGSGRVAKPRPDFVISRDPWFRPVDTTLGPDGALYIADFYNRIIGHYEVPLSHPGRDRERGRLWRVVYRGANGQPALRDPRLPDRLDGLVEELGSPSLTRRMLAMNELADRWGGEAESALRTVVAQPRNPFQSIHALWLLNRLDVLEDQTLLGAAHHADALVRAHAMRIVAERARAVSALGTQAPLRHGLAPSLLGAAIAGLQDPAPVVRRCAAEAVGRVPRRENIEPLLALLRTVPATDTHLTYGVRQALRDQLREDSVFAAVAAQDWTAADRRLLGDVAVAVPSEEAGRFLMRHLDLWSGDRELSRRIFAHAARFAPPAELDRVVAVVQGQDGADVEDQVAYFRAMQQGVARRGATLSTAMRDWGANLARDLLTSVEGSLGWHSEPAPGSSAGPTPWSFQERACADGRKAVLLSSFPLGEDLTGVVKSEPFPAPPRLSFFLAGHDGFPNRPAQKRNLVRLRDEATGEVLLESFPPRDDTAQRVDWDLGRWTGRRVRLEAVDGDNGDAYAWLAFGRLEPEGVRWPTVAPAGVVSRRIAAAEVAAAVEAHSVFPRLDAVMRDRTAEPEVRAAAARVVNPTPLVRATADLVSENAQPYPWRARLAEVIFGDDRAGTEPLIEAVWKEAPHRFQVRFAALAATSPVLAADIVDRMSQGRAPAVLLQDRRLRESLEKVADAPTREKLGALVASLPAEEVTVQRLVDERRVAWVKGGSAVANPTRGAEVFAAACAACHQIGGKGGLVGPQLNGIGTRGAERLCEDILAPNRNVDRAFWTTVLTLKDRETTSGLFRREEGETWVLANASGAEFTVRKSDVVERKESGVTLMPANFGEALSAEDFNHLLGYLVTQQGKP